MLSSTTGTPAVLVTISRLRVRYAPLGPSASIGTKSAATLGVSGVISVHAFDDGLALEGSDRPHRADRIADLRCGPGHPNGHIALQVVRYEHSFADVVHHHLAELSVRHLFSGLWIDHPEHDIGCPRIEDERLA